MNIIQRILFIILSVTAFGFSWPLSATSPNLMTNSERTWVQTQMQILQPRADDLSSDVLRLSLVAYLKAREKGMDAKQILTVIDYSKPSYEKRLWVFDLRRQRELYHTWVTHGKNSGNVYATSFSNRRHSLKSSIGVFVTDQTYVGHVGYAVRISGLERGINDNAYRRATVIHGARYVGEDMVRRYGRIGRSWGCPAVDAKLSRSLINVIKNNTIVVAYYHDRNWIRRSKYLAV